MKELHNKIPRRLIPWLIILILTLTVGGPMVTARTVTKLTLWTHQRHMANVIKELLGEFNSTVGRQKGIEVNLRVLGDDSSSIFQQAQKNGEGPDLYNSSFVTGYADPFKAGANVWYDNLPGFNKWKNQWPKWYWIEGMTTYHGLVYSIPSQVFNSRIIYNKDLFRLIGRNPNRPPKSYRELRQIAKEITKTSKGKAYGFAYCGGDSWPVEWMPSQWAEANGDPAYWDWKQGRWAMKGYFKVFQLLMDLKKDGSLYPGTAALTNEALRAQFAEGRIGMYMGEFWDVGVLNDQYPAKCDWGVGLIPTYDGKFHGKSRAMMLSGLWNINGLSRHQLEAWEVVKWFTRYEVRAELSEKGKGIDPDPVVIQYMKTKPKAKGYEEFAGTMYMDYMATYPLLPGWKMPNSNPCTVFRKVFLHGGNLERELTRLDQDWNRRLDRYYQKNPKIKRGWNTYPDFDRDIGQLGRPQIIPGNYSELRSGSDYANLVP